MLEIYSQKQFDQYFSAICHPNANLCLEEREAALKLLQNRVTGCKSCGELAASRCSTVFGEGNLEPSVCFVGEAPGADEDKQGRPFVGKAGKLLDKIMQACQIARTDTYIGNIIKCRPPDNRNPTPEEVSNCLPYLQKQLAILKPMVICALGAVAAQSLLSCDTPIGRLRGRWHNFSGIPTLCTYHPAYLLRNPSKKRDVWQDLQLLINYLQ